MRMLRWMCGKSRKDKIRNERFRDHLNVASIGDKLRETRFELVWACPTQAKPVLSWFGHVQHRLATAPVRKLLAMQVDGPS